MIQEFIKFNFKYFLKRKIKKALIEVSTPQKQLNNMGGNQYS